MSKQNVYDNNDFFENFQKFGRLRLVCNNDMGNVVPALRGHVCDYLPVYAEVLGFSDCERLSHSEDSFHFSGYAALIKVYIVLKLKNKEQYLEACAESDTKSDLCRQKL